MTILFAAAIAVLIAATAVIAHANLRVYRERRRWQAERKTADTMLAYHARHGRAHRAINDTGDEV